jgi:hypothetical protein
MPEPLVDACRTVVAGQRAGRWTFRKGDESTAHKRELKSKVQVAFLRFLSVSAGQMSVILYAGIPSDVK